MQAPSVNRHFILNCIQAHFTPSANIWLFQLLLCVPFNVGGKEPNMVLVMFMQLLYFCCGCVSASQSMFCTLDSLYPNYLFYIYLFLPNKHRISYCRLGKFSLETSLIKWRKFTLSVCNRDLILGMTIEAIVLSRLFYDFKTGNMHFSLSSTRNILKQKLFKPFISSLMCTHLMVFRHRRLW